MSARSRQNGNAKKASTQTNLSVQENIRQLVRKDLAATRNEYFFPAPQFVMDLFLSSNRQKKDAILFHCLFNVGVAIYVNLFILAIKPDLDWRLIALMTLLRMIVVGAPRFILALHAASHSPLFENTTLNYFVLNWMLGSFMGIPTGAYPLHHITMHHKEDNLFPLDLSSTMPYQRDNFLHFLLYYARFQFGSPIEFPYWMIHKGYYSKLFQFVGGYIFWMFLSVGSWIYIRPAVSLWIFILPYTVLSFFLMFGNWSQHIFVDPDDFANDYSLTVNCIDSPYNQATFNDGYHIVHHKYPYLHWKKLPSKFIEESQLATHAQANSICFREVDWFWIGLLTMLGRLETLATYFVPMTERQAEMSVDEIVKFLKRRLVPIRDRKTEAQGAGFSPLFGLMELLLGRA